MIELGILRGMVILLVIVICYLLILLSSAKVRENPKFRLPTRWEMHDLGTRAFRLSAILFLLSWSYHWLHQPDPRLYEFRDAQVEQTDKFKYFLTLPDTTKIRVVVCDDYVHPPMFRTGMVLAKVIFADYGSCWSVNPNLHAGYFIKRDDRGVPIQLTRSVTNEP